jgi:2',3'-cyclic-nucleotide 2'-phosphodiesterase (5'-nucleotidase family)
MPTWSEAGHRLQSATRKVQPVFPVVSVASCEAIMIKSASALAACLFSATASSNMILTANLSNLQENPAAVPTTSAGAPRSSSGTATFVINDAMMSMSFTGTVMGIDVTGSQTADTNDNLTAAHNHAGPGVTPLTNGPRAWGRPFR